MDEKISKKEVQELKHKTRRLSIKEGIFWSVRTSFGDQYISPFAIATGMGNSLVAILNSIWGLGEVSQVIGSKFVGKKSRKSILTKSVLINSLSWLFIAIIGILYLKGIFLNFIPYLIIIGLGIGVIAVGFGHPAWFSWIGDLVDPRYLGRWFSKRNTIISFTTVILSLFAAFILEYLRKSQLQIWGFIFLFFIAFLARFSCVKILNKHYEPPFKKIKEKKYPVKEFIKENKDTNLEKYIIFRSMLAFSIGLTSPLIAIYLLRTLQLDYISYILIAISGTLFSVLTLNLWGKIADKYGNYRVIILTTLIIPLTPILWIISPSKIYLFFIPALLGGTAWTAFAMASTNFIYDNTTKEKRAKTISYFNLFVGIGGFLGGLVGAYLISAVQTNWIEPIYLIFFMGAFVRMIVVSFWIGKFRESKKKRKIKNAKELQKIVIRELKPTLIEDMHQIAAIKDYLKEK